MKKLKVILIQDVHKLGKKNTVLEVSSGYADNYLIPNRLAVIYSEKSANVLKQIMDEKKHQHDLRIEEFIKNKNILESKSLVIFLPSHKGKVIGGVNPGFLVKEIQHQFGVTVSKLLFSNKSSISDFGMFTREIKFNHDVVCNLKIEILEKNHSAK